MLRLQKFPCVAIVGGPKPSETITWTYMYMSLPIRPSQEREIADSTVLCDVSLSITCLISITAVTMSKLSLDNRMSIIAILCMNILVHVMYFSIYYKFITY